MELSERRGGELRTRERAFGVLVGLLGVCTSGRSNCHSLSDSAGIGEEYAHLQMSLDEATEEAMRTTANLLLGTMCIRRQLIVTVWKA